MTKKHAGKNQSENKIIFDTLYFLVSASTKKLSESATYFILLKRKKTMFHSGITNFEFVAYFLGIFFDSFILVLAFVLLLCCFIGSLVYHLYLKKDDQHGSSLLNVLNGDLLMLLSFQSSMNFAELFYEKVLEDKSCAIIMGKRISNIVFVQMSFQLTFATLLNQFRQTRGPLTEHIYLLD